MILKNIILNEYLRIYMYINYEFIFRLGDGWETPVHKEPMHESSQIPTKDEKPSEKPSKDNAEETHKTPSNEELAKMWEPKTRQSIAQRLKRKYKDYTMVFY